MKRQSLWGIAIVSLIAVLASCAPIPLIAPPPTSTAVPLATATPAAREVTTQTPQPTATFTPVVRVTIQPSANPTTALALTPQGTRVATPQRTPAPNLSPTSAPLSWRVNNLLVGLGTPGRLYAFEQGVVTTESSAVASLARLFISDDFGLSWKPFPGGLPASQCIHSMNLAYATPDALYTSTCQGLYRWSGNRWVSISPRETGMVAIVYNQPQIIWATGLFGQGAVLRSDDDGANWIQADNGLVSFNGVANIAIDPRQANTLYAIIWPKYAGSYLRRGTSNGQWTTMPTPLNNIQIDIGMTLDGATGALYVSALNPSVADVNQVTWEMVHDFGEGTLVTVLASGWSPQGLALYARLSPANCSPLAGVSCDSTVQRSLDGGRSWSPVVIPVQSDGLRLTR